MMFAWETGTEKDIQSPAAVRDLMEDVGTEWEFNHAWTADIVDGDGAAKDSTLVGYRHKRYSRHCRMKNPYLFLT
jgi:hypothetical protein